MRKTVEKISDVCEEVRWLKGRFNLLRMDCDHVVDTLVQADSSITYVCNKVGDLCEIDNCPLEKPDTVLRRIFRAIG